MTVRNGGGRTIRWRSGGCDLRGSVAVHRVVAGRDDEAPGAVVDAIGQEDRRVAAFIAALAGDADGPTAPVTIGSDAASEGRACQIDHGFAELSPGMQVMERALWHATARSGAPIRPGPYLVSATFPMFEIGTPLVPADYDPARDLRPVTIEREIVVEGSGDAHLTSEQALRVLATGTDLGALVRRGIVGPAGATLSLDGEAWVLRVVLPGARIAVGSVAADGRGRPTFGPAP